MPMPNAKAESLEIVTLLEATAAISSVGKIGASLSSHLDIQNPSVSSPAVGPSKQPTRDCWLLSVSMSKNVSPLGRQRVPGKFAS